MQHLQNQKLNFPRRKILRTMLKLKVLTTKQYALIHSDITIT